MALAHQMVAGVDLWLNNPMKPLEASGQSAGDAMLGRTVNDPAEAEKLFGWGWECIVTDRLDLIGPDFGV